jgi:hypothetical protein
MASEESLDAGYAESLLRRFEPVIRFTKGEWFYPMDAEPYVDACSLWVQRPGEDPDCVVPAGELSLEKLDQQPQDTTGAVHYLKIPNPGGYQKRGLVGRLRRKRSYSDPDWPRETFRAGRGRLARVGYISRLADALFGLTLLARGRVPGGDVEGGRVLYGRFMEEEERYKYHGRVVRQDDWIVLQYFLFYAFNDWRSNFFGANDHEGDWEKVMVFLSESESGEVRPEWAAFAAHEETGDDLRRRWDDPELEERLTSRCIRLRRLAREPLLSGRVPDRTGVSLAAGVGGRQEICAEVLVRDAAPVYGRLLGGIALRKFHHTLR